MLSASSVDSVVLFSGGLDSTFNLVVTQERGESPLALFIDYGQKAAISEDRATGKICERLGVTRQVVSLPWYSEISTSSLTSKSQEPPTGSQVQIDSLETSHETAEKVWVPNRNGVLLSIAAAFAEALGASKVVAGFNREEAQTFPDNSKEFLEAFNGSLVHSTRLGVRVVCHSIDFSKSEIVQEGKQRNLPFEWIWPCYFSGERPCGECESCQRFHRALSLQGVVP